MKMTDKNIEDHKQDIFDAVDAVDELAPSLEGVDQTAIITLEAAAKYVNERQVIDEEDDPEEYLFEPDDIGAVQEELNRLCGTIVLYSPYEEGFLVLDLAFDDINFDYQFFGEFQPFDKDVLFYANWYNKEYVQSLVKRIHDEGLDE